MDSADFMKVIKLHFNAPDIQVVDGCSAKEVEDMHDRLNGDFLDALDGFSSDVLDEASKRLIRTRKSKSFPTLALCIEICNQVQASFVGPKEYKVERSWTQNAQDTADKMMNSEVGRRAADEGWIIGLHDFCREQNRLPNRFESEKVREKSLKTQTEIKEMLANGASNNKIVASVTKAMDNKKRRLSDLARSKLVKINESDGGIYRYDECS